MISAGLWTMGAVSGTTTYSAKALPVVHDVAEHFVTGSERLHRAPDRLHPTGDVRAEDGPVWSAQPMHPGVEGVFR